MDWTGQRCADVTSRWLLPPTLGNSSQSSSIPCLRSFMPRTPNTTPRRIPPITSSPTFSFPHVQDPERRRGLDRIFPSGEVTYPGIGAFTHADMATFMVGQGPKVVALFDSDSEGRAQEERLRTKWITRYKESRSSSVVIGVAVGVSGEFAIEDLFAENYYEKMANEAHKSKLAQVGQASIPLIGTGLIVDRVSRGCERIGIKFNKGLVAKLIRRDLSTLHDLSSVDTQTITRSEKLFEALNMGFDQ
jgi:hypothetical protein